MRLALSWLTILPVRTDNVDGAGRAIAVAPLVGLILGLPAIAVLAALHTQPLLAGFVAVGLLALLTRGMHVDGLADTADGLGCYGPPERALAVMRDGGAGPFGVVTLIVVLGIQAASFGTLAADGRWPAVVLACMTGRAAFAWCCLRGIPPARPEGFGALVAGSQPLAAPVLWTAGLAVAAGFAVPSRPWQGPIAVVLATAVVLLLSAHTRRRFGGITGDVLGAANELATTVVVAGCVL